MKNRFRIITVVLIILPVIFIFWYLWSQHKRACKAKRMRTIVHNTFNDLERSMTDLKKSFKTKSIVQMEKEINNAATLLQNGLDQFSKYLKRK